MAEVIWALAALCAAGYILGEVTRAVLTLWIDRLKVQLELEKTRDKVRRAREDQIAALRYENEKLTEMVLQLTGRQQ